MLIEAWDTFNILLFLLSLSVAPAFALWDQGHPAALGGHPGVPAWVAAGPGSTRVTRVPGEGNPWGRNAGRCPCFWGERDRSNFSVLFFFLNNC